MTINHDRYLYPVRSMGYGDRLNLVLRGCSIAMSGKPCYKCFSKDLWNPDGGDSVAVDKMASDVTQIIIDNELVGITITGGEPTDQAAQLTDLVGLVKNQLKQAGYPKEVDFLLFSWFYREQFEKKFPELFFELDALVLGPYQYEDSIEKPLLATSNQQLILNSSLAESRYADLSGMPRLDFAINAVDNSLLFIGIPYKDEMGEITRELQVRSIALSDSSWD